jgi:hypothetical protein
MLAKTIVEKRMAELLDYGGKLAGGDLVVCTPSRISRPNEVTGSAVFLDRCRDTAAFAFPCTDGCPLLSPCLGVRGSVDRAAVGRADEEGIGPRARAAGSPESLAWLGGFLADVDSTHWCYLANVTTSSMITVTCLLR